MKLPHEIRPAETVLDQGTTPRGMSGKRLLAGGAYLAILICIFYRDILSLVSSALASETNSHTVLIPFISAYLIYIRREAAPRQYSTSWWCALLAAVLGGAALFAANHLGGTAGSISHNDYLSFVAFALIAFVIAGGFLFLGAAWMRSSAFAAAFLLFAIPLPDKVIDLLEKGSQWASADVASMLFNLSGTPVVRDGLLFQLPGIVLEVAQECSGIRSSWILLITSLLASHMFLKTAWRRTVLVLFVIPLGFLRNGFRILVIALLCVHIGPEMIDSPIHHRGGPLFFALSLVPFFALLWWLRKGERRLVEMDRT